MARALPRSSILTTEAMQQRGMNISARRACRTARPCARRFVGVRAQAATGSPVPKTSIMVVGGTGTLGRQIVRKALDEGYDVRVLVRPRQNPADFLREWGATVVQGDLTDVTSIPASLVGVHTIIDCATARPEEPTKKIDWEGKVALIQCAQAMNIQKYVFFSIYNCDKYPAVPLMNLKTCTEKYLQASGLNHTIFRLTGFHQAVIGNYAVPILEDKQVWGTNDDTRTAYIDTQDVARCTLAALRTSKADNKTLTLSGPKAWSTKEIIEMCEDLADSNAQVTTVPAGVLKAARAVLKSCQWAKDAADRLAFAEVLSGSDAWIAPMEDTYKLLDIEPSSVTGLEEYLKEYFTRIMKKLKEVGASTDRTNFYV
uniref:NmrA-like domain-containing protein n=1 Tax=Chlamydomonas euryale TaxID=1486919 RepID=A0A7R9YQG0_9CHLO